VTKPIWHRSIYVDTKGMAWTKLGGARADFLYVLFMHGFSISEIHAGLDGSAILDEVEDAIRYGLEKGRGA
jgi:hypothetical protein